MKKLFPILLACLGASGAFAQKAGDGVTVSNDPAKVAAVEKHAQELKARAAQQQAKAPAKSTTKAKHTSTASKAKSKTKKTGATAKPVASK